MNWKKVYWNEMISLKDNIFYAEQYINVIDKVDKFVQMFIGLVTAASVSGWAIWKSCPDIWALIIGVSQVVIIIKPNLKFNENIRGYRSYIIEASKVFEKVEKSFYDVSEDKLENDEINNLLIDFRSEINDIEIKYLRDIEVVEWKYIFKKAKEKTEAYINKYYNAEYDEE